MTHLLAVSRVAAWGVLCLTATATSAQTVYRCANSYSQTPCAGALAIPVDDRRSPAQKAQTDAATTQARQLAGQMERERLALERSAMSVKAAPAAKSAKGNATKKKAQVSAVAPNASQALHGPRKKGKEPEFFTASTKTDKKGKADAGAGTGD